MDVAKMLDLIEEKHGIRLEAADPVLLLTTVAAELAKESREEFARIAAELSDQVSAALVLADTTAKARSERLITEAAKWSSEQIRGAGATAAAEAQKELADAKRQLERAAKAFWIAAAASVCAGIGTVAVLWL
jgi:hypothetical protein